MTFSMKTEHISIRFGRHTVIEDVSLDFPVKGITVLFGKSGSGKTTLLRSLNRLNEEFSDCTTTGQVWLHHEGQNLPLYAANNAQPLPVAFLRRKVGMVFQTPNVLPVSISKNITMPLEVVAGVQHNEAAVKMEKALHTAGLWNEVKDRLHDSAESLSGGQQQRLCLARALALEPSVLLLDEPTASLDGKAARVVEECIERLGSLMPVIMVSHHASQVVRLGGEVVFMASGQVLEKSSSTEKLSEQYLENWL